MVVVRRGKSEERWGGVCIDGVRWFFRVSVDVFFLVVVASVAFFFFLRLLKVGIGLKFGNSSEVLVRKGEVVLVMNLEE